MSSSIFTNLAEAETRNVALVAPKPVKVHPRFEEHPPCEQNDADQNMTENSELKKKDSQPTTGG
jgi:hypothetical protein